MDKISVITPIYNVAPYLSTCINSIINQSYQNLEIILVNDGSTDDSLKICQAFQKRDHRIKIINQENQGVSTARNSGIEAATGNYLTFLDPDDWYNDRNSLKKLYDALCKQHAKIIIGNFNEFDANINNYILYSHDESVHIYSVDKWFSFEYSGQNNLSQCVSTVWGKLYARDLFNHIRFPLGKIDEDDLTMWRIYRLVDQIIFLDSSICIYRNNRSHSITDVANPAQLFSLPAIEQRIALDRVINKTINPEPDGYFWRINQHVDHALKVGELSNYKHSKIKQQIIGKYLS